MIPKGLHVRINLQTGLKEAKLIDENVVEPESATGFERSAGDLEAVNLKISALTAIRDQSLRPEEIEKIKTHFKSYEEIKEELGELSPKTDAEILIGLMQNFRNLSKTENAAANNKILALLEDLEYLTHQYDNAIEFANQNGFSDIILKNLNHTEPERLKQTLKLLGTVVQNHANVQIRALEAGCVDAVLRILVKNPDVKVKNRAVFALGGIIRRFPLAQLDFVQHGGLEIFQKLFDLHETQLHLKIVTLINDMLLEHDEALKDKNHTDYVERVRQYNKVDLLSRLESNEWCENLNNLLFGIVIVDRYDHDSIEKTLSAILGVVNSCPNSMSNVISALEEQYVSLATSDDDSDGYYRKLEKLCSNINSKLKKQRTEL